MTCWGPVGSSVQVRWMQESMAGERVAVEDSIYNHSTILCTSTWSPEEKWEFYVQFVKAMSSAIWKERRLALPQTRVDEVLRPDNTHLVKSGPWWHGGKQSSCQHKRRGFDPWVGKILWRRKWQPTPGFFPGESHGQRSLVGYSPRGCRESVKTEWLNNKQLWGSRGSEKYKTKPLRH